MSTKDQPSLGRLVAVHPITPASLQRAVFIAVLSFLFFLAMLFAYYVRQSMGYFLLATAFLVVYLVMMFSIFMQRKSAVSVHERGFRYRNNAVGYGEVGRVSDTGDVILNDRRKIALPTSVVDHDRLVSELRAGVEQANSNPQRDFVS